MLFTICGPHVGPQANTLIYCKRVKCPTFSKEPCLGHILQYFTLHSGHLTNPLWYELFRLPDGSGVIGMSISTETRFDLILMTSSMAGVNGFGVRSHDVIRALLFLRPYDDAIYQIRNISHVVSNGHKLFKYASWESYVEHDQHQALFHTKRLLLRAEWRKDQSANSEIMGLATVPLTEQRAIWGKGEALGPIQRDM